MFSKQGWSSAVRNLQSQLSLAIAERDLAIAERDLAVAERDRAAAAVDRSKADINLTFRIIEHQLAVEERLTTNE